MNGERAALMAVPSALRAALAFGSIWLGLLLVPAARTLVIGQLQLVPGALRRQLPIGIAAGIALVAVDLVLLRCWGMVEIQGVRIPAPSLLALNVLFLAFLALTEEMVFRGVLYPRVEERAGVIAAVLITAVLFCGFHFVGRAFAWEQALAYFLDGLFLAGLVFWTRDLWTAFGWHLAKNVMVAGTFGGSYSIVEPVVRIREAAASPASRMGTLAADLAAFLVSAALCLALLWLTRRDHA